jgi:hypothetical protein
MEGKEKVVSDWGGYGSDNIDEAAAGGMVINSLACESDERRLEQGAA